MASALEMRAFHFIIIFVCLSIAIVWFCGDTFRKRTYSNFRAINKSSGVNIADLYTTMLTNISCIKTKPLLNIVRTTVCVHSTADFVSRNIMKDKIWEEDRLNRLFRILLRDPNLSFIDVGANIGVYTMFAAALRRFVVAIECFKPNIVRIVKAIQLEKLENTVLLIENAIYSESGQYVRLESIPDNIGSQAVIGNISDHQFSQDPFIVKTIQFNDILPFLKNNHVQSAILKVDIEGSEHILCQTGNQIFEQFIIPVVQMEWQYVRRYRTRGEIVLDFFQKHHYIATSDLCQELNTTQAFHSWPADLYWVKMSSSVCI